MSNKKISFIAVLFLVITTIILYTGYMVGSVQAVKEIQSTKLPNQGSQFNEPDRNLALQSSKFNASEAVSENDTYPNPNFIVIDNQSGNISIALSSIWNNKLKSCSTIFECVANFSTGWNDKTSIQVSTKNNTEQTWSSIYGQPIDVKLGEQYQLVSHMKMNKWATQSHMKVQGFNETSKTWYQIKQCPSGTNGPLEWQEFSCFITIPENTTKVRDVLNGGWSSQAGQKATTWFDSIYLIKFTGPYIADPNLMAQVVYQGLKLPTKMAFLGPDDILVLEKNNGTVQRIVNGVKLREPMLDVNVATAAERGMLGIAVQKNFTKIHNGTNKETTYVFLYFSEAARDNGTDLGNRLYRYEMIANKLVNPKLLLNLPVGLYHNGGQILIGPDKYLYLTVGELDNKTNPGPKSNEALNYQGKAANEPDGRGGILRIDQGGKAILANGHGILGDNDPLNKYYAYGIRNSFGMDFDPLTGNLWDTENGPAFGDEINLVKPGFNSGWRVVQGIWRPTFNPHNSLGDLTAGSILLNPNASLVSFNGKGKYSAPEFIWKNTVGPTRLKFLSTDKMGTQYENDIFVADVNKGRIYHFNLEENRTTLKLQNTLADKVANSDKQLEAVVFAQGFGMITDLEIGPDGYMYFVGHDTGKIYRIVPSHFSEDLLNYIAKRAR